MENDIQCSFCGKTLAEAAILLAGQAAYICNECVIVGINIIGEQFDEKVNEVERLKKTQSGNIREIFKQYWAGA
jgi:ATP-dependent Clp protease ATP-binding subunit ClpX